MVDPLVCGGVDESQPSGNDRFRFDFKKRPSCLTKKLSPFAVRDAPVTFRDLGRDSDRRATHLRRQAKPFVPRKTGSHVIHVDNEINRAVKRNEIMN